MKNRYVLYLAYQDTIDEPKGLILPENNYMGFSLSQLNKEFMDEYNFEI